MKTEAQKELQSEGDIGQDWAPGLCPPGRVLVIFHRSLDRGVECITPRNG
jgi:hypothetical protein